MKRALVLAFTAILAIAAPAVAKKKVALTPVGSEDNIDKFLPPALTPDDTWDLDLSDGGRVVIQLRPDKAPLMVERIKQLTKQGFYNGLIFHRVIDGFMAQGGDPKGTGEGGSTLPNVKAEFNDLPHVRGAVAAARAQEDDSANSQFYIMFLPNLKLDKHYTVFGRVVSGMDYADAIARGEPPVNPTRVIRATMGDDPASATPPPAAMMAPAARAAPTGLPSGALQSGPIQPKASRAKKPR